MASDLLDMSVELTKGYLIQNKIEQVEVANFIKTIHQTLTDLRNAGSTNPATAVVDSAAADQAPGTPAPALSPAPTAESEMPMGGNGPETETGASEAEAEAEDNSAVAPIRSEDISDARYKGLDPWLAMRISPRLAEKLDPKNKIHPTVFKDKLICLEDGAEVKLLRSYVRKHHGLEFHQYMGKWHLPADYPTAPEEYLTKKRDFAKKTGLGTTTRAHREKRAVAAPAATPVKAAKAKPGPKPGAKPTKKQQQAAEATTAKAAGARGTRRELSLFDSDKRKKAAEPSMA